MNIKLFNQVMADLGESFLKRGVYVDSRFLSGLLDRFAKEFWTDVREIVKNDEMITKDEMFDFLAADVTWLEFSIR